MTINPNKYIRGALIPLLKTATGLTGVWHKKVPKAAAIPDKYILITSQAKQPYAVAKDCYEWLCTFNIDIHSINEQGNSSAVVVDDIEEDAHNAVMDLTVTAFDVKFVRLVNSIDLDAETQEYSIDRRILTYELWLNRARQAIS